MKPRIKIFYVPGMISIIAIPIILCFFYFPKANPERITSIVFVAKYEKHEGLSVKFDTTFLSNSWGKRKYLKINLNSENLKPKLDSIRGLSRYLYKYHDTINGIHIVLDKNCKFETFIHVVSNLKKDSVAVFAPFENNIWVFYNLGNEISLRKWRKEQEKEKPIKTFYLFDKPNYSSAKLFDFFLEKWPIPSMFLLLLVMSIYKVLKKPV